MFFELLFEKKFRFLMLIFDVDVDVDIIEFIVVTKFVKNLTLIFNKRTLIRFFMTIKFVFENLFFFDLIICRK